MRTLSFGCNAGRCTSVRGESNLKVRRCIFLGPDRICSHTHCYQQAEPCYQQAEPCYQQGHAYQQGYAYTYDITELELRADVMTRAAIINNQGFKQGCNDCMSSLGAVGPPQWYQQ